MGESKGGYCNSILHTKQPGLIDLLMAHDDFPVGHACAPSLHCACCVLVPW